MPPSPALRISPGRELKAENHKRGRSLESGILFQDKDDDLALFNEVQNKERDHFLLQATDDFDDLFSAKQRHFSDYKLGITIPARGESSDLLNAEGDKNDYDWLITPPETPLFTSLDDEAPTVSLAPRGRPRSQPITISRSSTIEKAYQSGRGSPSPRRLSPSPRPSTSTSRTFSATHSSSPPTLRHSSPSRRLSPPPCKPIPPPRTSTPTPRRLSTGSTGTTTPSRVRGASPVNTTRGNSASPKIKAWQSNIPGFSSEAPPNLRTSLADRPASYVRGSSPASRNGSRSGSTRQSMSPTATRSVSSSHSHERDQYSSYSRGSVASSGDDDEDSLQSVPIRNSERSVPRSMGASPNNKTIGISKKPTKTLSNSAPKRTFDMALRQMERKGPQHMFRPLLSSVPTPTFYAGKASTQHRALTSRNSSITTSSNASSDQGTSGALDTEENEQNQDDVTSDFVKGRNKTMHEEVFVMDHDDAINESVENKIIEELPGYEDDESDNPSQVISQLDAADSSCQLDTTAATATANVVLDGEYDYADAETPDMEVCSGCSGRFPYSELVREGDLWFCLECNSLKTNSIKTVKINKEIAEDFVHDEECGWLEVLDHSISIPESVPVTDVGETAKPLHDSIDNDNQHSCSEPSKDHEVSESEKRELTVADQQEIVRSYPSYQQSHNSGDCSTSEVDGSEGTGISLLLKISSGTKGHLIQSRSFTACNICYDDFSYVKDSVNSLRSSCGYSNASVSSSTDLGSSKQTEARIHRQSSGRKSDENYRYEIPTKLKRSISSMSGASVLGSQGPSTTPSCLGDSFELVSSNKSRGTSGLTYADPLVRSKSSEKEAESKLTGLESSLTFNAAAELSSDLMNVYSGGTPIESILDSDERSLGSSENLADEEMAAAQLQTPMQGKDTMQSSCDDRVDVTEVPHLSSLNDISEMKIDNVDSESCYSQSDVDSKNSKKNEVVEHSIRVQQNGIMITEEFEITDSINCVLEDSTVVIEAIGVKKPRSLTLEEATDTILFCSSIVHNLAYEAANVAIEKENSTMELLRPTMTLVGKSNPDRRDTRSRPLGKRSSKTQKARQRRVETDTKAQPIVAESEEKSSSPSIVRSPSKANTLHPPKLESKCNCAIM